MDVGMTVGNAAVCLGMSGCSARAGTVCYMGGYHPHLSPLPSREREIWLVLSCSPVSPCHPVDTALKPV